MQGVVAKLNGKVAAPDYHSLGDPVVMVPASFDTTCHSHHLAPAPPSLAVSSMLHFRLKQMKTPPKSTSWFIGVRPA